jgi:hypothetical protein
MRAAASGSGQFEAYHAQDTQGEWLVLWFGPEQVLMRWVEAEHLSLLLQVRPMEDVSNSVWAAEFKVDHTLRHHPSSLSWWAARDGTRNLHRQTPQISPTLRRIRHPAHRIPESQLALHRRCLPAPRRAVLDTGADIPCGSHGEEGRENKGEDAPPAPEEPRGVSGGEEERGIVQQNADRIVDDFIREGG